VTVPGVVGREEELAEIERFLDAAARETTGLALEGEAGIGKSTIWRAARELARRREMEVLTSRPSGTEARFSFSGLADLLGSVPETALSGLPEPQRIAIDAALLRSSPGSPASVPQAAAAGFVTLIQSLARDRPVLIAVDDLPWLDVPSRRVLEFAARRLEAEPVGLVYARRLPATSGGLEAILPAERLQRVDLKPLSLAALGRIAATRLGRTLPRPLLVRIHRASGGNPFYGLELARLIVESDAPPAAGSELPVPEDLRALASDRIRRLPASVREELLLAAVLANPNAATVNIEALGPAEEAGIVSVDAQGQIEFTHPLFASAAFRSVSTARRQALHRRAAELAPGVEERARHLALASVAPDPHVARRLDDAARLARDRGAPEAGAELSELAASRTPATDPESHGTRLLTAARLYMDAGDLERAEHLAQEALSGDPPEPIQAQALQLTAQIRGRHSNFGEAAGVGARALALAQGDDRLSAEIEMDLGFFLISLGDFPGSAARANDALAHARASNDSGLLADALAGVSVIEFLGGMGLSEDRMAQALELEEPDRVRMFAMRPTCIHGMLQLWRGETAAATETLGALQRELAERGQEGVVPLLSFYLVWACLWQADFSRARRYADECLEACHLLDDAMSMATSLSATALCHAHTGATETARSRAQEALTIFERLHWWTGVIWPSWALGLAELADGRPDAAHAILGPLAEQQAAMGVGDPVLRMFLPDEIEALIALGALDQAETYLSSLERLARDHERSWALAAAGRCRGALEAARGRPVQAFEAFDRALSEYERAGMPFERARTLLLAGQARRRFKQRGVAGQLLGEAVEVFERLGAVPWAARASQDLARVGHRGEDRDALTAGERHVAELAASGLSNRDIAERAFLSVKTVEATLTRVYRKLGTRSRASLARALDGERAAR
jgi:DNA-binding CsgD family transcriptional regulator